jgi:hypothetical protein
LKVCKAPDCPYTALAGDYCYYDAKKKQGFFNGRYPVSRHHVRESAVFDDEQRELADTLEEMGADHGQIRRAVMKKVEPRRNKRRREGNGTYVRLGS